MEDYKLYRANLKTRFNYHISFWSGLFNFFTQSSPYDEAIDKLQKMDVQEAFKSDVQQLHRDFHVACEKHNFDFSLGKNQENRLADACE
jgi:hypothetical protein